MIQLILAALIFLVACERAPARLVAGKADTVVVNNRRPVQLPVRVVDARGGVLESSGVRYERHVYDRATSPDQIRPGQHLAIPVRLTAGEMRRWRIPASPELLFLTMLPMRDGDEMPRVAIVGANCGSGFDTNSFFCLAQRDAAVIAYHPREGAAMKESSGTLAVWRQDKP